VRWWPSRRKEQRADAAPPPDEARLVSDVLGYDVEPGSPTLEMSAALAADAMTRLEELRTQGLWTDELERRWNAAATLAARGDVEGLAEAVEGLLDEATRVRTGSDPG
jgi:hypothetical protein